MAKMRRPVQLALLGVGGIAVLSGLYFGIRALPGVANQQAKVPEATASLRADVNRGIPRDAYELTAQPVANFQGCPKVMSIPWNATIGLAMANGGPRTTSDSLVKQYSGGCIEIERQDDYAVISQNLIAFNEAYRDGGATPNTGAAFAIIMGDGLPAFAEGLRDKADVVVVGVVGFSDGEDKCMGKPLNGDPQNARGSVISAVPRDGDQNICIKWAADNEIPVNTDNAVYDPTAINFVDTTSFVEAGEKFTAGYCERREEARGGIKTGETVNACVDGVATWTPGDATIVESDRAGVVSWASTREYNQQMPAILIANRRWAAANKAFVVGILRASDRAAFQIRSEGETYLPRAGAAMAAIYGQGGGQEGDPSFWTTYYVGKDIRDNKGNTVNVGGSRVTTLAEVRDFLGMTPGSLNVYKGVYEIFGNYAKAFYPDILPSFPAYDDVVTTEFINAALAGTSITRAQGATTAFATNQSITTTVGQRAYSIEFETGSARISPRSAEQLFELANQAGMTNLRIRIDGHTDNVGNPASNMTLSSARANAVKDWLVTQAPTTFPANRIQARGYGDTAPKADNSTPAGQTQNRRVEIILGN